MMEQASAWHCCVVLWVAKLATWWEFHIQVQNAASTNQKPHGENQKQIIRTKKTTGKPLWKVKRSISEHSGG